MVCWSGPYIAGFFAAGLTVFDPVEGFASAAEFNRPDLLARLEVQNLIREIGLIDEGDLEDEAFHEIELEIARAIAEANNVATDKEDLSEEANKRADPGARTTGRLIVALILARGPAGDHAKRDLPGKPPDGRASQFNRRWVAAAT